jgi:(1->4)-alpha-D-glucan 1-alpha-D-glucosylmutase
LLYQTLAGAWPSSPLDNTDRWKMFGERMENYMLKAIREAKQNTSWINRNAEYENAVLSFVRALLAQGAQNRFLNDFLPFQRRVARIGLWNGLAQTLLKLTCPGVPDIYQGNEVWDFSLVDPDNRRPVEYLRHRQMFESIRELGRDPGKLSAGGLLEDPEDGRIKLYLIWRTLCLRQQQADLFREGEYLPLAVEGVKANHVVAFIRKTESTSVLVVVPRLVAGLLQDTDVAPIGPQIWGDTRVLLSSRPEKYRNTFTGESVSLHKSNGGAHLPVSEVLKDFPVALCSLG